MEEARNIWCRNPGISRRRRDPRDSGRVKRLQDRGTSLRDMFGVEAFLVSGLSPIVAAALVGLLLVLFLLLAYLCCGDPARSTASSAGQEVSREVHSRVSETEHVSWHHAKEPGEKDQAKDPGKEKQAKKPGQQRQAKEPGQRKEYSKGTGATAGPVKVKDPSPAGEERVEVKKSPLYPIKELAAIDLSSSQKDLTQGEEESLEQEAAAYAKNNRSEIRLRKTLSPSALPLPPAYAPGSVSNSFLSPGDRRQLQLTFLVFEVAEGARVHAPVEYRQVKELAEAVRAYGIGANFTISRVERLSAAAMTPGDWQDTVKAVLNNMGQYLEWKVLWHEQLQAQARANASIEGQQLWTFDMLAGVGAHANDQTAHPWQVYAQIATAAVKAWKSLPRREGSNLYLSKITQGTIESFSDFVARMTEAAGRIFGEPEQAMPLIEQMIFENATAECLAAVAPWRAKGLQELLGICHGLGGSLTNAGLAAANLKMAAVLLQGQGRDRPPPWPGRGAVCVFPQGEDNTIWVPMQLV
ncbi:uncharacterized protein LOC143440321 [Arvicanthis niloticus]|uniref:uncharacterized protein LOC143310921 n=1 Tax=Arvicanthis niloticus TaxID=61156 RepID=UPI00402B899A